jgi:hypothetical protein
MTDTRSELVASLALIERPKWEEPSRLRKRPPVTPPRVSLFLRLLALLGL